MNGKWKEVIRGVVAAVVAAATSWLQVKGYL